MNEKNIHPRSSNKQTGLSREIFRDEVGVFHLGFTMKLKDGHKKLAEYKQRHKTLWKELAQALQEATIFDYVIFVDETGTLFASLKYRKQALLDALPEKPIMKKWWRSMKDLMVTKRDNSPQTWELSEIFYFQGSSRELIKKKD